MPFKYKQKKYFGQFLHINVKTYISRFFQNSYKVVHITNAGKST